MFNELTISTAEMENEGGRQIVGKRWEEPPVSGGHQRLRLGKQSGDLSCALKSEILGAIVGPGQGHGHRVNLVVFVEI